MDAQVEKNAIKQVKKDHHLTPWLFVAPHLIIFAIFFLIPVIFGIYISFTNWDLIGSPKFIGLANYKELLFDSSSVFYEQLRTGLKNTFLFVLISVPFCIIIPLLMALALNVKPKLGKFFQALFYLPSLFAISAVAIIWNLMFNVTYGPINNIFHLKTVWTGTQPYAWIAIVVVTVWWTIGGNMIIYQAALNGISKDYYEAAEIDGATPVQQFFKITLPSIRSLGLE